MRLLVGLRPDSLGDYGDPSDLVAVITGRGEKEMVRKGLG